MTNHLPVAVLIRFFAPVIVASAALLTGCATTRTVDAQVQSFAPQVAAALPAKANYRFERLPSQQAVGTATVANTVAAGLESQVDLEAAAAQAFAAAGWNPTADAPYTVLVAARSAPGEPSAFANWPWPSPMWSSVWSYQPVLLRNGRTLWVASGSPWINQAPDVLSNHEVSVLVRHVPSGQVVFEARAASSSRARPGSSYAAQELQALVEAALKGFPTAQPQARNALLSLPNK